MSLSWESVTPCVKGRNGLPRQSADWLAMTGFFDSLDKNAPHRGAFLCAFFMFYIRSSSSFSTTLPPCRYTLGTRLLTAQVSS